MNRLGFVFLFSVISYNSLALEITISDKKNEINLFAGA